MDFWSKTFSNRVDLHYLRWPLIQANWSDYYERVWFNAAVNGRGLQDLTVFLSGYFSCAASMIFEYNKKLKNDGL